ncbi:hypothetical protein PAP_09460 [Palaeococcus pacificus DY20341]|uniref:HTH tetR-type domain-containing protein n=1 Tax=Palaeococcus pacificus DY20341 TaxID=1343739 RepID=A0A075M0F8_9EURY|nr:TetR/AcrR family transcriptional regulator [Palaeococcus pacificus]AIF70268.1 hypothetical protein PAP_09460 [Palaeococcus pacificus DY20341]
MGRKETRERILEVALELFSERAYDDVSMEEIAKKVGISKGGLFYHFSSKYELAKEALFYGFEQWAKTIFPKILSAESPEDKFKALIEYSFEFILNNPKLSRFFLEVYEESIKHGNGLGQWDAFYEEYLELFGGIFEELGVPNPRLRAMLFGALLDGLALHYLVAGDEGRGYFDIEALKREIFEMFRYREREIKG